MPVACFVSERVITFGGGVGGGGWNWQVYEQGRWFGSRFTARNVAAEVAARQRWIRGEGNEQGRRQRFEEHALLLVLRQEPARGAKAHRRADRVHLRRMRRTVHGHHPGGEQVL